MANLPPRHQWVETLDGTRTLFSEHFQESCHSTTGAREETLLHYIKGCEIKERIHEHEPFVILEVGFGLGIGLMTTIEALKDCSSRWHFISLEIDRDLVEWFREQHLGESILKDLYWANESTLKFKNDYFELTILIGDARQTLADYTREASPKWHAIYQDAFSPKKNPFLWTKEWFELLKKYSAFDVILSTYSSSSSIRKSLMAAGWLIQKGEKFGPKRSSTRARLTGSTDEEILLHLQRSPVTALTDDNAKVYGSK